MAEGTKGFEVVITEPAEVRYFDQVLEYLERNFSEERVDQVNDHLFVEVVSLKSQPFRGTKEPNLDTAGHDFRFILFRETRILEIKIVYWVDTEAYKVFVIDFFPTRMNPSKMGVGNP